MYQGSYSYHNAVEVESVFQYVANATLQHYHSGTPLPGKSLKSREKEACRHWVCKQHDVPERSRKSQRGEKRREKVEQAAKMHTTEYHVL